MNPEQKCLSQRQEKLLLKWLDGECNWLERWQVRRLIDANQDACSFIAQMEAVEEEARGWTTTLCSCSGVDLWDKVARRIEQEERTELLLGRRMLGKASPLPSVVATFGWGVSGAVVAAGVVAALIFTFPLHERRSPVDAALPVGQPVNLVSSGNERPLAAEQFGGGLAHGGVDFDWVHSQGRVRLIQDPASSSAILWVRRRGGKPRSYLQPTARSEEVFMHEERGGVQTDE